MQVLRDRLDLQVALVLLALKALLVLREPQAPQVLLAQRARQDLREWQGLLDLLGQAVLLDR